MTDQTPTGIRAYDLTPPSKPLAPAFTPLRNPPHLAAIAESQRRERERVEALRVAQVAAYDEWQRYADWYADHPVAKAAFDMHQPEVGYDRVVCDSCMEDIGYEAGSVTWPCVTFAAMKEAADEWNAEHPEDARPNETAEPSKLKTPDEWCELYRLEIRDPDGWRGKDAPPWDQPIGLPEFWDRFNRCTVRDLHLIDYDRIVADVRAAREAT